jgi:hypothetical protein
MICSCLLEPFCPELTMLPLAGPTRGFRHALGRNRYLSLLHRVDVVDGMLFTSPMALQWFSF